MKNIGDRILEELERMNLSQKDLAEKVNVQEATISRYVNNERQPRSDILSRIAAALNVTSDYLLGRCDERCLIIDEPEISLHEQYANKIAKILESEGLEYTEDSISEIISFSKYILSKKKKQD